MARPPPWPRSPRTGDGFAAGRLADLLADQGRVQESLELLRVRADAGDWFARRSAG